MPPPSILGGDVLLGEEEVARALGLSVRTLQSWRVSGTGPAFVKMGRAVRYRRSAIEAFIEASTVTSTSEPVRPVPEGSRK